MSTETTTVTVEPSEIRLLGQRASVRALLVALLVITVCAMSMLGMQIMEPLYTMGTMAVGYYFGQNMKK